MGISAPKPRASIIIIDDDPIYLRLWEKIFESIPNCQYYLTKSSQEAMDLLDQLKIDLLISDIILPDQSGYEIACHARGKNKEMGIILTTAYTCDLSRFKLRNPKFHILYKPYRDIHQIQNFIARLLRKEDLFQDMQEDSHAENQIFPFVTEWKL